MESQLCFYCVVSIYIPPPYQDEDLVMLDRDQDHFWISNYEENEIDLNLVIIIRVGFQVQVNANVSTFWPCCFATMFQLYKITLAREQNNTPHIPKIIMISVLTKDKIYPINGRTLDKLGEHSISSMSWLRVVVSYAYLILHFFSLSQICRFFKKLPSYLVQQFPSHNRHRICNDSVG